MTQAGASGVRKQKLDTQKVYAKKNMEALNMGLKENDLKMVKEQAKVLQLKMYCKYVCKNTHPTSPGSA